MNCKLPAGVYPGAAAIRDNIFLSDSDGDDSFGRKIDFNPSGVQAPGKPVEVKKGAAKVEDESRSSDGAPSTGVASPKEANHAATTTTSQDAADKGAATGTEENAAKGDDSSDDLHFSSDTDDNEKPKPWKVEPKSEKSNDADDPLPLSRGRLSRGLTLAPAPSLPVRAGADPTARWEEMRASQGVREMAHRPESSATPPGHTRFVIVSDTHGKHRELERACPLPAGDVLLHCGDFTNTGEEEQVVDFVAWMRAQPHPHKIVIAGNHDVTMHRDYYSARGRSRFHRRGGHDVDAVRQAVMAAEGVTYLEDSGTVANNFLVWGSPWQPEFCDWAFNLDRGEQCQAAWATIPTPTDVLLTHGPPLGHGDLCSSGHRAGCEDLLHTVQTRLRECRLHAFGHIHEGYGVTADKEGRVQYVNASSCTLRYYATQAAIVVDLPTPSDAEGDVKRALVREHQLDVIVERAVHELGSARVPPDIAASPEPE